MGVNVYALAAQFYREQAGVADIVSLNLVERYLRKLAWQRLSDEELCKQWQVLETVFSYLFDQNIEGLGYLTIFDYQEILYCHQDKYPDFKLEAESVHVFLQAIARFYQYLSKQGLQDDYSDFLQEVEESLYINDTFLMPERREDQSFYRQLENGEDYTEEELDLLNDALDQVLKKIGSFFSQNAYVRDNERALRIFCGPAFEVPTKALAPEDVSEEESSFWLSFWDYFIFDYHLLSEDVTPIYYYFYHERQHLPTLEQDILRDLLQARFTVFYIVSALDGVANCRDLFTDEQFELPLPDLDMMDFKQHIFYGHMHSKGVLLLNYVTSLAATPRLRSRMRDVVLRQFELYRWQEPDATLVQFFWREAASVRHILNVMSDFAQLNMLPHRKSPLQVKSKPEIIREFQSEGEMLGVVLRRVGFSKHATSLQERLWESALSVWGTAGMCRKDLHALLTAVLFLFIRLNGYELSASRDLYEIFASDEEQVQQVEAALQQKLQLEPFDARYLTEDGFVLSLYLQSEA